MSMGMLTSTTPGADNSLDILLESCPPGMMLSLLKLHAANCDFMVAVSPEVPKTLSDIMDGESGWESPLTSVTLTTRTGLSPW